MPLLRTIFITVTLLGTAVAVAEDPNYNLAPRQELDFPGTCAAALAQALRGDCAGVMDESDRQICLEDVVYAAGFELVLTENDQLVCAE